VGPHIDLAVVERHMNIALPESYTGLLDYTGFGKECRRMVRHIRLMVVAFPSIHNHIVVQQLPLDQFALDYQNCQDLAHYKGSVCHTEGKRLPLEEGLHRMNYNS
jgi:hypothetical protein